MLPPPDTDGQKLSRMHVKRVVDALTSMVATSHRLPNITLPFFRTTRFPA